MYDIYIKNYYESGALVKEERRLYSIPIQEEDRENVLTDPTVSSEVGKTGTLEFTIYPNHPFYHALAQMRTIMRVDYDGDTIFRGRILTIDNTLTGVKKVHCEGDMAFLLDSFQEGSKKESRSKIALNTYIKQILNAHNTQMGEMGETDKNIYPGYIPGNYPSTISSMQQISNVTEAFGSDSYEQSMNALEELSKEYGGFFRTRYSSADGKTYLDWCRHWFRKDLSNSQPIAITQNIIDAQSNSEVDNIFTALIPIGKNEGNDVFIDGYRTDIHGSGNRRILVPHITQVLDESKLNNGYMTKALYEKAVEQYGIIYKTQNFSNADTQAKLWEYACEWIKDNYVGGITNYDLSAVDMHHVDGHIMKYLAGDCVNLTIHSDMTELDEYNPDKNSNTVNRTLLSIKYDLHHPEKNSYTAGISSDILNREYGTTSTSKSKSGGGGGGGGAGAKVGGGGPKGESEEEKEKRRIEALDALAYRYVIDASHNSAEYAALEKKDTQLATAALNASQVRIKKILDDPDFDQEDLISMVLDGQRGKITMIDPLTGKDMLVDPRIAEKAKQDPRFMKIINGNNMVNDAVTSIVIESGLADSAIQLRGNKKMTEEDIKTAMIEADINPTIDDYINKATVALAEGSITDSEDMSILQSFINSGGSDQSLLSQATEKLKKYGLDKLTDNELVKHIEKALSDGNIKDPNIVAQLKTITDSLGNKSGKFTMGKEDNEDISLDAGGRDGTGTAQIGKKSGNWLIQMNQPLQYSEGGVVKTMPAGVIDASDYAALVSASGNSIPSFTTKAAVIDTVLADTVNAVNVNAQNIKAVRADVQTLTAKAITTDSIDSILANADFISTGPGGAQMSGGTVSCSKLTTTTLQVNGTYYSWKTVSGIMLSTGGTTSLQYLGAN